MTREQHEVKKGFPASRELNTKLLCNQLQNQFNSSYQEEPYNSTRNDLAFNQELAICIDAGGSKCSVAISDSRSNTSIAEGASCNYTSIGPEKVLKVISETTQLALDKLSQAHPEHPKYRFLKPDQEDLPTAKPRFRYATIGIAGIDRPGALKQITPEFSKIFNVTAPALHVSNDVDFLTFIIRKKYPTISYAIVLIAGTGSIAISYSLDIEAGKMIRVRRAGGWGSLLGDDGSGFEIGKQGIRSTLSMLENTSQDTTTTGELVYGEMHQKILKHFGVANPFESGFDLLSKILKSPTDGDLKMAVAEVARIVLDTIDVDIMAAKIVDDAVEGLVKMVKAVMPKQVNPKPALLMSGGLMKNQGYRDRIMDKFCQEKLGFEVVEFVGESPALQAVRMMFH